MTRATVAAALRWLLVTCGVAALLVAVVQGVGGAVDSGQLAVLLPFAAVALAAAALWRVLPELDRLVARVVPHGPVTPESALAEAARRIRAGSLEEILPGLAEVMAAGTGARQAAIWLVVEDHLVEVARHPPEPAPAAHTEESVPNLAVLLERPDTDQVVPVLDGPHLQAVLAISKSAATVADRRLLQDLANGAGLLLRVVALNVELAQRVRRAADLADELRSSQQRLASARDAERRRLVGEIAHATSDRMACLRAELAAARAALGAVPGDVAPTREALSRARVELDHLLARFRAIVRGVYPAVLRDQGVAAALEELVADLPRPVDLTGGPRQRLGWEIESGVYFVTASALRVLAGRPADRGIEVRLDHAGGRVSVCIEDPSPPVTRERLGTLLSDDAERLGALGGDLEVLEEGAPSGLEPVGVGDRSEPGPILLRAWLPDRLEPIVEATVAAGSAVP
jgi:signal transduction histidine kinase